VRLLGGSGWRIPAVQPGRFGTGAPPLSVWCAAKLASSADRAVAGGAEVDLQRCSRCPAHDAGARCCNRAPSPQDVVELRAAEAKEEVQTFALDGRDEGLGEGIGVGRDAVPVRDLDGPDTLQRVSIRVTPEPNDDKSYQKI